MSTSRSSDERSFAQRVGDAVLIFKYPMSLEDHTIAYAPAIAVLSLASQGDYDFSEASGLSVASAVMGLITVHLGKELARTGNHSMIKFLRTFGSSTAAFNSLSTAVAIAQGKDSTLPIAMTAVGGQLLTAAVKAAKANAQKVASSSATDTTSDGADWALLVGDE